VCVCVCVCVVGYCEATNSAEYLQSSWISVHNWCHLVIVLTFIEYWAYGNNVSEYLLYSTSGPTWLVTVANVVAFLQIFVTIHVSIYLCSSSSFSDSQALHKTSTHLIGFCLLAEYTSNEIL
jgi:hypothetical protein